MSLKQTIILALAMTLSYATGVVSGRTERFELEGNMKFFGVGNGIIFPDGTKQTSAGVGSANDLNCPAPCVGGGEIASGAVGTSEVVDNSLTSSDLAVDSVTASEILAGAVGTSEIASGAVGSAEVAANSLTSGDLAVDSVTASEIDADAVGSSEISSGAVGTSEVANKSLTLDDLAMTIHMGDTIDLFNTFLNNGQCSGFVATAADGVPANAFAHVFGVKLGNGNATGGWEIEVEDNPSNNADSIKINICNRTGIGPLEVPTLRFNFWAIG